MSEPSAAPSRDSFLQRHHFLFRRLHSLSGIVPVGLFLIMHLFTNFQLITGDFQHEVNFIHSMPALLILEMSIWLGIAFHAGLGLLYTFSGNKLNTSAYPYGGNIRYLLQRVTGIIALLFILLHIMTLRWHIQIFGWKPFFVTGPDGTPLATASTAKALQDGGVVIVLVYLVGMLSVVYHWCNGLWTAAITWGATVTPAGMKRWGYVCTVLAVALAIFGLGAIAGALRHEISPREQQSIQQAIEQTSPGIQIHHFEHVEH